ncbi:uncharacterized protein UV8b_02137 [Ustilaginoidea virens]|uniref:Uncharacterized protein n=1 Tax=Ustilaginoidea virens TaxID=1159556 RepID=A0A8E5MF98_USTVR|nr:uncharacterized protein UV8b_02137 [Ustilaginoidea virens]QUC17896.1 hypothetical protein UV8b_02137 [Ustilaginoidea virens]
MKCSLLLLSLTAVGSALPTWRQGPIMSDDDNLMERRDIITIEIVQAQSSRFTNTVVTKITKYASDAQGFLTESFKGAVADGSGELMTVSDAKPVMPLMRLKGSRKNHHHHNNNNHHRRRHRISLLGFRNRLAVLILAFALVLAVACSYLRRIYIASLQHDTDTCPEDAALLEKASPRKLTPETAQS